MGSVSEGEDVVQESCLKAYRALVAGEFAGRARLETWLHRIVVRIAYDALRQRKRRPQLPGDAALPVGQWDGGAAAHARLALQELDALLAVLPAEQRIALVLKQVEGFSAKEIAVLTASTEGAVEQRSVRARAALRPRKEAVV
ncbi:MAG: RNA polymerase sigma factor [Polyangiales bacterium]